jgi:DNA repair exonuclease SbcCD nuclease subunit
MSKVIIIGDTHAGVRNGSGIFLDYTAKFFKEVFFPYCEENNIKRILHLGDYFDHRKHVNFKVLCHNHKTFIKYLYENDMHMDLILGNHDVYYKDTNNLNSLTLLLKQYDDVITIHEQPKDVDFDGLSIGRLPSIITDHYDECMDFIKNSKSSILGGHLELSGFKMMQGAPASTHGMEAKLLNRFEMVLSGHYHTKSTQGNIHYLGTQFELTWADAGDPKYFHILDTKTRELTPIRNHLKLFNRLIYKDGVSHPTPEEIKGCYIKIVVAEKKDLFEFDKFIEAIYSADPFEVKIVESFDEYSGDNVSSEEMNNQALDTKELINQYVEALETDLDKNKLKAKLQEMYVEALQCEAV